MAYPPFLLVAAKYGFGKTSTMQFMLEWIEQNTSTRPTELNFHSLTSGSLYRPRSKLFGSEIENTLWKMSSRFGHSTVVPTTTGRTCGLNVAPFWETSFFAVTTCTGFSGAAGWLVPTGWSIYTTKSCMAA